MEKYRAFHRRSITDREGFWREQAAAKPLPGLLRGGGFVELHEPGGDLGHLHEAEHALIHARTAACRNDNDGQRLRCAGFDEARQLFADDRSH